MSDYQYGFIRSWHIVKSWTRVPGRAVTYCGRTVVGDILDELRLTEKSCETCARLAIAKADPPKEDDGSTWTEP